MIRNIAIKIKFVLSIKLNIVIFMCSLLTKTIRASRTTHASLFIRPERRYSEANSIDS